MGRETKFQGDVCELALVRMGPGSGEGQSCQWRDASGRSREKKTGAEASFSFSAEEERCMDEAEPFSFTPGDVSHKL